MVASCMADVPSDAEDGDDDDDPDLLDELAELGSEDEEQVKNEFRFFIFWRSRTKVDSLSI